jgi:hypothetical protein
VTVFPTEATPWDGKGGGEGGVRIRGRTFMILERPTSISRSQVGGGEGRQGLRDTNQLALVLIRVCTLELAWGVEGGHPDRVCKIPSLNMNMHSCGPASWVLSFPLSRAQALPPPLPASHELCLPFLLLSPLSRHFMAAALPPYQSPGARLIRERIDYCGGLHVSAFKISQCINFS